MLAIDKLQKMVIVMEQVSGISLANQSGRKQLINLLKRDCFRVPNCEHISIRCLQGSLWITELRSDKDIVIDAGDCVEVNGRKDVIVEALTSSHFEFALPSACCA
ncbi:DUF2917 domain-containing protein [Undibacterium sp. TJN19]|uniref:DUF2917 domain-containing protein n=1 Tax=Undibacterium sp. TJN19 TaxID=3413055 RepID=UPI003BF11DD5